ncbi:hypothetical protein KC19_VG151200, partial [Ceratodon purpureus]
QSFFLLTDSTPQLSPRYAPAKHPQPRPFLAIDFVCGKRSPSIIGNSLLATTENYTYVQDKKQNSSSLQTRCLMKVFTFQHAFKLRDQISVNAIKKKKAQITMKLTLALKRAHQHRKGIHKDFEIKCSTYHV